MREASGEAGDRVGRCGRAIELSGEPGGSTGAHQVFVGGWMPAQAKGSTVCPAEGEDIRVPW